MQLSIFEASLPDSGISRMIYEWTKTYPKGMLQDASDITTDVESPWETWLKQVGIPLPDTTEQLLNSSSTNREAIQYRRSVRIYDDRPFSLVDLSRILSVLSLSNNSEENRPYRSIHQRTAQGSLCKLSLLALNVDDLQPGAYLFDDVNRSLYTVRSDSPKDIVEQSCFQREFNAANVIFMVTGSIRQAVDCYGDRGYRYLLIEAGTWLSRLYFAAGALGMSGCTTGSFAFGALERWVGFDGYNQALTVNFAIGHRPIFSQNNQQ